MRISGSLLIIMVAYLLLPGSSVKAQKKWTLEECIEYALDNNIRIKRKSVAAEQAENNFRQSKFEYLPTVNGRASHDFNSGKTYVRDLSEYITKEYQYSQFSITSNLTLFDGLETQNRKQKRKFDMLSQLESIKEAKYDVKMNVATYYLNILSQIEKRKIKREQLNVTLDQIEQTKHQVEVGNKAKGDLLEIKAQAARERMEVTRAKNELKMAYLDLTQLMNLDSANNFKIYAPEYDSLSPQGSVQPADKIYGKSVEEFPTIKNYEYQVQSSLENLQIMKGRRYPRLDVGINFQTYYNNNINQNYQEQVDGNLSMIAGVSLNIPIFNNRYVENQVQNAKLSIEDSKYRLKESKQNLFKNIQRARNEAINAFKDYQANMDAVNASREAFEYAEQKYEVGLVDIVEYKIAKKDLTEARLNAAQAKYNYYFRLMLLEFYMGKELTFETNG
jgi:outer membrane protein